MPTARRPIRMAPIRMAPIQMALCVAALTAVAVGGTAGPAWAHAEVVSTFPSADGTVQGRLTHVGVTFDDTVELVPGSLTLATDLGVQVNLDRPTLVGDREIRANLQDAVGPGNYVAGWRIRADDGHVESGTFGFTIAGAASTGGGGHPAATAPPPVPAQPGQPLWPVLVAIGLAVAAGLGAGLVVRRGLRAIESPDFVDPAAVYPAAADPATSRRFHGQ